MEEQILILDKISILKEEIEELKKILKKEIEKNKNEKKQQNEHYNQIILNLFDSILFISKKFENLKKKSKEDLNFSKKLFDSNLNEFQDDKNKEEKKNDQNEELLDFKEEIQLNSLLEIENRNLKNDLSDLLSDIENVEKSAYEISSLMNQIQSKLGEDTEKIENLQKLSEEADDNIENANENFDQIKNRSGSFFDNLFIYAFLFASFSVLFLDLVN